MVLLVESVSGMPVLSYFLFINMRIRKNTVGIIVATIVQCLFYGRALGMMGVKNRTIRRLPQGGMAVIFVALPDVMA